MDTGVGEMVATALYSKTPNPCLRIGKSHWETKNVANTLNQTEESLVIRTDAVDCLTFKGTRWHRHSVLPLPTICKKIRYRDGIINGYPSGYALCRMDENGIPRIHRHYCQKTVRIPENLSFVYVYPSWQ